MIISEQLVNIGGTAMPPSNPSREGFVFLGWDKPFDNVIGDLCIKAKYTKQFTVTFLDYDDTILSKKIVNMWDEVVPPEDPYREGYLFTGWDKSLKDVVSDRIIKAVYDVRTYTVTFKMPDENEICQVHNVEYGGFVEEPLVDDMFFDWNQKKGCRFTGWNRKLTDIIDDTTIYAIYEEEIEEPIIAIESIRVLKGTAKIDIRVYICGMLDTVNGIDFDMYFENSFSLSGSEAVTLNHKIKNESNSEEIITSSNVVKYSLSWVNTEGIEINGYLETACFCFSINKTIDAGDHIISIDSDAYIVREKKNVLVKEKPIIIQAVVEIAD